VGREVKKKKMIAGKDRVFGLILFLRAFLSPQYFFNDLVFEASC
jgi:hypothetical protein